MIHSTAFISSGSIIEDGAIIGANVHIGPFCYISAGVEIGSGSVLTSHVVMNGLTRIGRNNHIAQFCSIGEVNQDLKYRGEPTRVEIGDGNRIHEKSTIHRGTLQGIGVTRIGNDNVLMENTHVGHDCIIGSHCTFAHNVNLGGHVEVDDYTDLGAMAAIHQFCIIGTRVRAGKGACVVQDIPPFVLAQGNRAAPYEQDNYALEQQGFGIEARNAISLAYRLIYRSGKSLDEIKIRLAALAIDSPVLLPFTEFFRRSNRGIIR